MTSVFATNTIIEYLFWYGDDLLIFGFILEIAKETKNSMLLKFDIKVLNKVNVILWSKITRLIVGIFSDWSHYIEKVFEKKMLLFWNLFLLLLIQVLDHSWIKGTRIRNLLKKMYDLFMRKFRDTGSVSLLYRLM